MGTWHATWRESIGGNVTELSSAARGLLDEAHCASGSTPADRIRNRAAIQAGLGGAVPPGLGGAATGPVVASNTALPLWLAGALVVGLGVVAGWWFLVPGEREPQRVLQPLAAPLSPPRVVEPPSEASQPPSEASEPSLPSLPSRVNRSGPQATAPDLGAEVALLQLAYASWRAGDAAATLRRLDEHVRRFPASQLRRDRASLRVLTLCASARGSEARAAARGLRDAQGQLPPALRGSCVEP